MAEAQAEMQRMEAKLANDTEIARAKRDFDLKKASPLLNDSVQSGKYLLSR